MNNILIRNLTDQTKKALRIRAAENGRSMEEEVKTALNQHLGLGEAGPWEKPGSWLQDMLASMRSVGGTEFPAVMRDQGTEIPDFGDAGNST